MQYALYYRKPGHFFWRKLRLTGHRFIADMDRMVCFRADGGITELAPFSRIEVKYRKSDLDVLSALKEKAKSNDHVQPAQGENNQ